MIVKEESYQDVLNVIIQVKPRFWKWSTELAMACGTAFCWDITLTNHGYDIWCV